MSNKKLLLNLTHRLSIVERLNLFAIFKPFDSVCGIPIYRTAEHNTLSTDGDTLILWFFYDTWRKGGYLVCFLVSFRTNFYMDETKLNNLL